MQLRQKNVQQLTSNVRSITISEDQRSIIEEVIHEYVPEEQEAEQLLDRAK